MRSRSVRSSVCTLHRTYPFCRYGCSNSFCALSRFAPTRTSAERMSSLRTRTT